MIKHVVSFSGGTGSWAAARRVVDRHGPDGVVLLFADVLIEDADLYRFIDDAARDLGVELVRISDGRTPWQVFRDVRFLGNSRVDPCSLHLKRHLLNRWIADNAPGATVHIGIDWTESHRYERHKARAPYKVEAPLCEPPYLSKADILASLRERGIEPPRLYSLGFPHNNCGGGCVKAGQAHFRLLLRALPDRYAEWEREEQALRDHLGKDVSILRDRKRANQALTLREFRERIEAGGQCDLFEWGGCGCALDAA